MKATAAYVCLYLAFIGFGCAILGALLWIFAGFGVDPIFHGRYPA